MPPTAPITIDMPALTVPQGAVIATSPARAPLPIIARSGLPVFSQIVIVVRNAPAVAANIVLRAMRGTSRSAASSEPGLKPNHPIHRMNTPRTAKGMLWPGIARGLPSGPYLPMRGPSNIAPISAAMPPVMCTMPDPAKSE
jgi:hypothetical protein